MFSSSMMPAGRVSKRGKQSARKGENRKEQREYKRTMDRSTSRNRLRHARDLPSVELSARRRLKSNSFLERRKNSKQSADSARAAGQRYPRTGLAVTMIPYMTMSVINPVLSVAIYGVQYYCIDGR